MKLNPPASSSDLDRARTVARRLHERAHHEGRSEAPSAPEAAAPAPVAPRSEVASAPAEFVRPAPGPEAVVPPEPEPPADEAESFAPELEVPGAETPLAPPPGAEVAAPEHAEAEPAEPEPVDLEEPAAPDPPSEPELPSTEPALPEPPDEDDIEMPAVDTPVFEPPAFDPPEAQPPDEEPPAPSPGPDYPFSDSTSLGADEPAPPEAAPSPPNSWGEEAGDALSALAGAAEEPSLEGLEPPPSGTYEEDAGAGVEDLLGGAPAVEQEPESPFDVVSDTDAGAGAADSPDDLVGSPGPSWDDVAEASMALAGAHGSMLVDTSGQVLTAQGDWPEPGPDAIAGRLVSMMDRTLQDAPTRSVSAPIAGQHLTAWRIPANEGYLTIVFMGEAPLSADVRPDIDEHIRQALGI